MDLVLIRGHVQHDGVRTIQQPGQVLLILASREEHAVEFVSQHGQVVRTEPVR